MCLCHWKCRKPNILDSESLDCRRGQALSDSESLDCRRGQALSRMPENGRHLLEVRKINAAILVSSACLRYRHLPITLRYKHQRLEAGCPAIHAKKDCISICREKSYFIACPQRFLITSTSLILGPN